MHRDTQYPPGTIDPSIRDTLECDAWIHHPGLASRKRQRQRRKLTSQRRLRWQDRVLIWVGIVMLAGLILRLETDAAYGQEQNQAHAQTWGMQLATADSSQVSLALDTAIHAEITGLTARVIIAQSFRNDSEAWAEGIYRFPLPDGAAVDQLYIQVGDRVLEGEIQEREVAQRVYQQARSNGQTASLVEQERANQFKTRLANIGPGEEIHVMIGFLANVEYLDGAFSLRLPTTFNRRHGGEIQPGLNSAAPKPMLVSAESVPDHSLLMQIDLLTDIGFAAIESRYHDVDIEPAEDGYKVTLLNGLDRTDRDFELTWYPDLRDIPQASLMTWDGGDALYAQLMLVPPADESLLAQPREVIFIIDTSGSMEGASIVQAQAALLQGLQELDERDRFNLIQFNSVHESLFPSSQAATSGNLQRAREYIHGLVANGGTLMAPALGAALTMRPQADLMRQVVFITDGSAGNERELLGHIGGLLGQSRLFTVGIGSAPNSWFMRKAAEIGRGSHVRIGRLDEVEDQMNSLWTRIRLPAISDLCIDWGVDAEYYPEVLPDLYAGSPLWVIARLPSMPGFISLCGELNGQVWNYELEPLEGYGNETLATLWAQRKVESLQDSVTFGQDPELMRTEITRVALDYNLLTPHTSLVAVDRTPARMPEEALAIGQVPSLLPAGSTVNSAGFPSTATGWKAQLMMSAIALLIAGWLFFNPLAHNIRSRSPVVSSRGLSHAAR